jgi:D-glycero-alpha-D-manno-heptose-7-phosphate kinase
MIVRSKAPLRISFGGGGTDVSPYAEERGGAVLSATIDRYSYSTLITQDRESVNVHSLDFNISFTYNFGDVLKYDGNLDLVKAALKLMEIRQGFELILHSDAPPGTGLGSSSAAVVTMVGVFKHLLHRPLTDYQVAELAYRIEREEAGIKGGRQDHYAATFGGFNFIEFLGTVTIANPLRIKADILNELQYRLMLCYSGRSRVSAEIIKDFSSAYAQRNQDIIQALDETKALAFAMKNALLLGQLNEFGSLLHEAWCIKKRLSPKISDSSIDALYELARQNGAIGGKILGAGGGGYLLLLCEFDKKHLVTRKLEEVGVQVSSLAFEPQGLQTWEVNP